MDAIADPNTLTNIGIGGVFVLLLLKEIPKFIHAMKNSSKQDDGGTPFTEKTHDKACELASLRMEKYFQKHFVILKDELFKELRRMRKGNGDNDDGD